MHGRLAMIEIQCGNAAAALAEARQPPTFHGTRGAEGLCCAAHQRHCARNATRCSRGWSARSRTTKPWPATCSRIRSLHLIDVPGFAALCKQLGLPVPGDAMAMP
jgi:hypothetical protein